jgi:hypothetical protein
VIMVSPGFFLVPTLNSEPARRVVELTLSPMMKHDAEDGADQARAVGNSQTLGTDVEVGSGAHPRSGDEARRSGGGGLSLSSSRTTGTGGRLGAGEAKGAIGDADLEEEGDAQARAWRSVWRCSAGAMVHSGTACTHGGTACGTRASHQRRVAHRRWVARWRRSELEKEPPLKPASATWSQT